MPAPTRFAGAEAQLHQAATEATGLSDFGADDYLPGLRVLLKALDVNQDRPASGREFIWGTMIGSLIGRLFAAKGWRERPECLQQAIVRPIIITGIPRTGTTALHKLMSVDPQFQGLEMWLTNFPMPRPPRDTWESNPYFQAVTANLKAFFEAVPEMRAMHDMVADEVDECLEVLKQGFTSNRFGSTFGLPEYDSWWLTQDERASYRHYANVLRLVGSNEPEKRWLLKNPGHVWNPEALLEVFPDACIIQTHRDPAKAIPSLCSILSSTRSLGDGGTPDPLAIGRRETHMWSEAMRRTALVRSRVPGQFYDVDHRNFHADPLGVIRNIYARFDLTLSAEAEQRMRARIAASPERSHGTHDYTAEHFGLTREGLHETFRDYINHYKLV
jgi:hypothetical protein